MNQEPAKDERIETAKHIHLAYCSRKEKMMAQNQYKCEACGATFNTEAELEEHKRTMHAQYKCDICGRTFGSESELETHNSVAHPEETPAR